METSKQGFMDLITIPAQTIMVKGIEIAFEGISIEIHRSWHQDQYGFWRHRLMTNDELQRLINNESSVGLCGASHYSLLRSVWGC